MVNKKRLRIYSGENPEFVRTAINKFLDVQVGEWVRINKSTVDKIFNKYYPKFTEDSSKIIIDDLLNIAIDSGSDIVLYEGVLSSERKQEIENKVKVHNNIGSNMHANWAQYEIEYQNFI